MGYTHYWKQSRPFTKAEWATINAEAQRICAKAMRGDYYTGAETFKTAQEAGVDSMGFRSGFGESGAWRTFPHEEIATPMQGAAISLCGPDGTGKPIFDKDYVALNGDQSKDEDYETFWLDRQPKHPDWVTDKSERVFNFTKTEYRPYDAVVVSILHVARTVAPDAIEVSSDGGAEAIKLMF